MIASVQQKMAKAPRPKGWLLRLLALFIILVTLVGVGAGAGAVHQLIPARAAGGDWPTYLHDVQRSGASSDTILSTGEVPRA